MIALLALRNLVHRPWRSALLFLGYGLGVGVMVVLLAIGEALLAQASDEKLVGGGEITVLPEGLDVEVMKTGGLGGLFFSIPNARFVQGQLLAAPRLARDVRAVAPQIDGKLLYLRLRDGRELGVRAAGEVPSASAAVGAGADLGGGAWRDDDGDHRWAEPTPAELRHAIDRFHLPPANIARPDSWAEWHYFNVLSADRQRWAFVTLMVGGRIGQPDSAGTPRWGGQVLVTTHAQGAPARRFSARVGPADVRFSTADADLRVGTSSVRVLPDGRYAVRAEAVAEDGSGARVAVDLVVAPAPRAYFPGATLESGDFASGYAVAGLRADATGSLCVGGACERFDGAQSYHDHNWGTWQGVTWEWGAARAGAYTLLYGRVQPPDSLRSATPLFVYVVDSLGFRALFRPRTIRYEDARTVRVAGREVRVPARGWLEDVRGRDTLRLELLVEDAVATDTRIGLVERGEAEYARQLSRPYFVQMKGVARLSGRAGGAPIAGEGAGFFETYR
ncbi:hypothetical protein [Roseisolibacter agri]|uniref:Uncharacterized protein n=1 Tax=Roseisolibacter agri TaxID=2014610 RepID=A0AA37Q8G1_9BACT|nr:hypothetical protein [Roseisolibacter agri]GLC24246.1 hypothetical protein rosag_07590 [Roseisolibacter agri]